MAKLSMEYLGNLASLSYASGWAGEAKGSYFLTNIIINVYFTFNNYGLFPQFVTFSVANAPLNTNKKLEFHS